jgi:hypothetical protein
MNTTLIQHATSGVSENAEPSSQASEQINLDWELTKKATNWF